jgi:hypothetical protein
MKYSKMSEHSFNKGKHLSEETRAKLSVAHMGLIKSPEACANISRANRGRAVGPLNSNWKGGASSPESLIRVSILYAEWRMAIFERDDFACSFCGKPGVHGNLRAHHMDCFADFPEKRLDVDNGITFCVDCHKQFHLKYGTLHNRRWQTDEFLLEAMSKSAAGAAQPGPIDDLLATLEVYQAT